ncbi:MAG TPA: hypothetical protein VJ912_03775 [Candidatus Nanoarchaeia archaeon]|nr:hypothetical protein [Candidatus Nanoarchaeia archaeon]
MLEKYFPKGISRKDNHIRWNYEVLDEMVLYHFVFLGDKNYRDSRKKDIFENLNKFGGGIEFVRPFLEDNSNENRKYVFTSVKSRTSPDYINWQKIEPDKARRIKDKNLREKMGGSSSIEDYVSRIYNQNK